MQSNILPQKINTIEEQLSRLYARKDKIDRLILALERYAAEREPEPARSRKRVA
jgi:hypothetical protein